MKDQSIETLRGFAIIFMVAGHIIGESPGNGMKVSDDSAWRYFYFTFEYLRMPLFTVISGYVYSLWPIGNSEISVFLKGKARRLLLPMATVGTIYFLMQHFVPGTNVKFPLSDIWRIYIFPFQHFWFLQSIFLIFISIAIIDHFNLIGTFRNWLLIFLSAILIRNFMIPSPTNFFSYYDFFFLLPFFLLGCGIKRYESMFSDVKTIRFATVIFVLSIILQQLTWFLRLNLSPHEENILSLFVACSGIILLFYVRKNIDIISRIGYYAFGIYLFHVFATAGSRIFLMRLGMEQYMVMFVIALICGLGFPIILELTLSKSKILKRLLLGLR